MRLRTRPNHALPFRQAQGPESVEGQRTPKALKARPRLLLRYGGVAHLIFVRRMGTESDADT
jgi:hypothetical protein